MTTLSAEVAWLGAQTAVQWEVRSKDAGEHGTDGQQLCLTSSKHDGKGGVGEDYVGTGWEIADRTVVEEEFDTGSVEKSYNVDTPEVDTISNDLAFAALYDFEHTARALDNVAREWCIGGGSWLCCGAGSMAAGRRLSRGRVRVEWTKDEGKGGRGERRWYMRRNHPWCRYSPCGGGGVSRRRHFLGRSRRRSSSRPG